VTPVSLADSYPHSGGACCPYFSGFERSEFHRKVVMFVGAVCWLGPWVEHSGMLSKATRMGVLEDK
jgi:hypothetical protein